VLIIQLLEENHVTCLQICLNNYVICRKMTYKTFIESCSNLFRHSMHNLLEYRNIIIPILLILFQYIHFCIAMVSPFMIGHCAIQATVLFALRDQWVQRPLYIDLLIKKCDHKIRCVRACVHACMRACVWVSEWVHTCVRARACANYQPFL